MQLNLIAQLYMLQAVAAMGAAGVGVLVVGAAAAVITECWASAKDIPALISHVAKALPVSRHLAEIW